MLRLRLLGGVSVLRDGAPVGGAGAQRRPLAVLAVLAASPDAGVSREKLIFYLWPDSPEERARRVLAQTLYALRRDLQADELVLGSTELRLNPAAIESDVAELRAAAARGDDARVAALYAGPFLDGFHVANAPELERWAEGERARLATVHAQAVERLASAAAARGDHRREAELWQRLASLDPLDGRVAARLVRALAAAGDRAGALRHARLHETLMREELDAPPDPAVVALAESLRNETPAPTAVAPAAPVAPVTATAPAADRAAPREGEPAPRGATPSLAAAARDGEATHAPAPAADGARHWRRAAGFTIIALALAVGVAASLRLVRHRPLPLDARRVVVAPFENETGDSTLDVVGRMTADWITQRLAETRLVDVVDTRSAALDAGAGARGATAGRGFDAARVRALAEATGAGTVVWGSYYRDGDSLRFQARVTDAAHDKVLRALDEVSGPVSAPLVAIDRLRERVTGALAVLYNPQLSAWIRVTSKPPTYAAYEEFMDGIDADVRGRPREAIAHYLRAASLDTTYAQPILFAVDAEKTLGDYATADSLVRIVLRERDRLGPFDQAFADNQAAELRGDWVGAYDAAQRMEGIAPGPEALMLMGQESLDLDRPAQAFATFMRVDPSRGWLRGWDVYWEYPCAALHLLGEHERELTLALRGRKQFPRSRNVLMMQALALAAMGRTAELERVLDESVPLPAAAYSAGDVMLWSARELRAHGHADAVPAVLARARAWLAAMPAPETRTEEMRVFRGELDYAAGDLAGADSVFHALAAEHPGRVDYLARLGSIAARRGDRKEALRISARLARLDPPFAYGATEYGRARIAALLGDRDGALELLRAAYAAGKPYSIHDHSDPDFAPLWGDAEYRELMKPGG